MTDSEWTDSEWIESLDNINNPKDALREILENEQYFGFDSYYSDIRSALLKMAKRIVNNKKD